MFLNIPERTPEWHAQRLKVIGGSEIAGLFDCQPDFGDSKFTLYYVKSGRVLPLHKSNGRARSGTIMEPAIAEWAAEVRGWKIQKGRYATDDTTPGMGASLDYEILRAGEDADGVEIGNVEIDDDVVGKIYRGERGPLVGPGVMQVKQVDRKTWYEKWVNNQPPDYIGLQVHHEMACAGYSWGVVVCQIGGNDLGFYFYQARPALTDAIRAKVTEFWDRVAKGEPYSPSAGNDGEDRVLRALFPRVDAPQEIADLSADNELPDICADLASWSATRLDAEKKEKIAKARLKAKIGSAAVAFCTGWIIKCSVTPEKPPRLPAPGELIGGRAESRKYVVTEDMRP